MKRRGGRAKKKKKKKKNKRNFIFSVCFFTQPPVVLVAAHVVVPVPVLVPVPLQAQEQVLLPLGPAVAAAVVVASQEWLVPSLHEARRQVQVKSQNLPHPLEYPVGTILDLEGVNTLGQRMG